MSTRPTALKVKSENIPSELKNLSQWVMWRYFHELEKDEWTKPPCIAHAVPVTPDVDCDLF